jgi:hypothetical protein
MKTFTIEIEEDFATCEELGICAVASSAEEAVRIVAKGIRSRYRGEQIVIHLPYMGPDFLVDWHDTKPLKPPPPEDDFELAQKIHTRLYKDANA